LLIASPKSLSTRSSPAAKRRRGDHDRSVSGSNSLYATTVCCHLAAISCACCVLRRSVFRALCDKSDAPRLFRAVPFVDRVVTLVEDSDIGLAFSWARARLQTTRRFGTHQWELAGWPHDAREGVRECARGSHVSSSQQRSQRRPLRRRSRMRRRRPTAETALARAASVRGIRLIVRLPAARSESGGGWPRDEGGIVRRQVRRGGAVAAVPPSLLHVYVRLPPGCTV
jgi:hypothetical protein